MADGYGYGDSDGYGGSCRTRHKRRTRIDVARSVTGGTCAVPVEALVLVPVALTVP